MTDSLSVQPQIQKKDNTMPYALGGAAIGGIGGAVAANYGYGIPTKPDLDKVFAMDPDTFKKHIENAGENKGAWETAQDYAKKIQDAEKDYDAKIAEIKEKAKSSVENLPADHDAKKALNTAQNNYDEKFAELLKDEKAKLEAGNKSATTFPSRKTLSTSLSNEEFKEFEKYLNDYENAKTKLLGNKGAKYAGSTAQPAYNAINTEKTTVNNMYKSWETAVNGLSKKDKEKFLSEGKSKKIASKIQSQVDALLPEKFGTTLSPTPGGTLYSTPKFDYNQFKAFQDRYGAEMFEIIDKNPGSTPGKSVFKVKNGTKDAWVVINKDAVKTQREAMKNAYTANLQNYVNLKEQESKLAENFFKANEASLKNDLHTPINNAKDLTRLGAPKDYIKAQKYMELMEASIEKGVEKYPIDLGGGTVVKNAHELKVAKMQLAAEKDLATAYQLEKSKISNEIKAMVRDDIRVVDATKKFQNVINNDKGVKNAIDAVEKLNGKYATEEQKALYQKVKGLFGGEAKLSAAEIEAQAKTKAEGAIAKLDVATKLQQAKDEAKAAAEKLGSTVKELTDEEAIKKFGKTKEEFVKNVKDDATKAVEKNLEKMKMANKTWTGLAAAAALALAGIGIAAMNKKDA